MENPVKILRSNQSFEVDLLRAKLQENGIESYVVNKQDSAYVMLGEIELFVDASNLEKAKSLLTEKE